MTEKPPKISHRERRRIRQAAAVALGQTDKSPAAIARGFGRTTDWLYGVAAEYGINMNARRKSVSAKRRASGRKIRPSHKAERNLKMADAYRSGATLESLSVEYGLTRQRVHQILKTMGLNRDSRITPADTARYVQECALCGASYDRRSRKCPQSKYCSPECGREATASRVRGSGEYSKFATETHQCHWCGAMFNRSKFVSSAARSATASKGKDPSAKRWYCGRACFSRWRALGGTCASGQADAAARSNRESNGVYDYVDPRPHPPEAKR